MPTMVNPLSLSSLYAELYMEKELLSIGNATVFCIQYNSRKYLITNWHVVTGIHPETGQQLETYCNPNFLKVYFLSSALNLWIPKWIPLIVDEDKKWIEYRSNGEYYDVVAIPIDDDVLSGVSFNIIDINIPVIGQRLKIYPSKDVSIVGFPKGYAGANNLPIWKTGNIATEYEVNYQGRPLFLIDATTQSGMSGSPVVVYQEGMCLMESNGIAQGSFKRFLGVYSGRITPDSAIGRVWKPETLATLFLNTP